MDLASSKYVQASSLFPSNGLMKEPPLQTSTSIYGNSKGNPFGEAFPDPLCKLNLKETSEFVKSFPMAANESRGGFLSAQRRREGANSVTITPRRVAEAPSTPGRPVFSFCGGSVARKSIPSKWDDAEKWLMNSSGPDSPAQTIKPPESSKMTKQIMFFAEKSRVIEQEVPKLVSSIQGCVSLNLHNSARGHFDAVSASSDVLLKDKFTDEVGPVFPNLRYLEPSKEGFLFRNSACETMKDAGTEVLHEIKLRDFGTEMTPLGSSTTSRCHTPFKSSSPGRHNTPANSSGPLVTGNSNISNTTIDIAQLQEFHLAKLQLGTQYDSVASNWSSREEEEEEISKSLRHFETGTAMRKSISDSRAAAWEEEEKTKCCLRYQREEAKIQAWINLQNAKAEAQSRKLEMKIQKMRSNFEEKLMKRMAIVHRKAEEWRATALQQHAEQIRRAADQAQKMNRPNSQISGHGLCGCFPCNNSC